MSGISGQTSAHSDSDNHIAVFRVYPRQVTREVN